MDAARTSDHRARVQIFDGQHKAAAQVLLGVRRLPVRVFVNPDLDILLTTNTNAGTTLRQVAFDLSVQRYLGSEIYADRIRRYQLAHGKSESYYGFSEKSGPGLVLRWRSEGDHVDTSLTTCGIALRTVQRTD